MTCHFRHLKEVFTKAGIDINPKNKQQIDRIIHNIVGVDYKDCPAAWHQVKKRLAEDEAAFVSMLKNAWNNQKISYLFDDTLVEKVGEQTFTSD